MHAVAHLVGGQRAANLLDDLFMRRDLGEGERHGRTAKPIEMLDQFEDPAVVHPQAFPNGVAALHSRIKGTDARLVAMHQPAVDVDKQVSIAFVEFLEHGIPDRGAETQASRWTAKRS